MGRFLQLRAWHLERRVASRREEWKEESMPLVRIDAVEGRSKEEIKKFIDATHRAVLSAFKVPQQNRCQIYEEHPESNLVVEDTGLAMSDCT
jgi:hypothetical protein